jgi:hypothetical protein
MNTQVIIKELQTMRAHAETMRAHAELMIKKATSMAIKLGHVNAPASRKGKLDEKNVAELLARRQKTILKGQAAG